MMSKFAAHAVCRMSSFGTVGTCRHPFIRYGVVGLAVSHDKRKADKKIPIGISASWLDR
jgi:hypothetical protein